MKIMISLSALVPSQYRKFVKGWDKGRYAEAFNKFAGKDAYRVYLPLAKKASEAIVAPKEISHTIESLGYRIEDYRAGIAVDKTGKRKMRMGKLLAKYPQLQKQFNEDAARVGYKGKHLICISRHPYDIAGMSTDRGWTSCMHIEDGSNKEYVAAEINVGTIVAYVIEETDTNLNRPVARILIKPFYREDNFGKGRAILVAEPKTYPSITVPGFVPAVQRWLDTYINKGAKRGSYVLNDDSYGDGNPDHIHLGSVNGRQLAKELDFDESGKSKVQDSEIRISMLKRRPEALEFMVRATNMDLLGAANDASQEVFDYLKSGKTVYMHPYGGVIEKADDKDIRQIRIQLLVGDISLFDQVDSLPPSRLTDDELHRLLSYDPAGVIKYGSTRLTQDIVMRAIKTTQKLDKLRELLHALPSRFQFDTNEMLKTVKRYVFAMKNPTLDNIKTSFTAWPRNLIWMHSIPLTKADTFELMEWMYEHEGNKYMLELVDSVLTNGGIDYKEQDTDIIKKARSIDTGGSVKVQL